jgi:hypothetical protein
MSDRPVVRERKKGRGKERGSERGEGGTKGDSYILFLILGNRRIFERDFMQVMVMSGSK